MIWESASNSACEAPAISSFPLKPGKQLKLKVTMESLGGGLWFPNYHIFRVNNKKLMIVLAILTGFNKIGSLERGRLGARQFCLCRGIFVSMCLCTSEETCINVCFCSEKWFFLRLCTLLHVYLLYIRLCDVRAVTLAKKTLSTFQNCMYAFIYLLIYLLIYYTGGL